MVHNLYVYQDRGRKRSDSLWANWVARVVILALFWIPAQGSTVSFTDIPECARNSCLPFHASSIGCTTLSQDCFCSALAPINCASNNCTGDNWHAVEDWFATQCPNPPNVTLSGLPQCSRKCFRTAIVPRFCTAQISRTCFCRLEKQFEALYPCIETNCDEDVVTANTSTVNYFRQTCVYQPSSDGQGIPNPGDPDSGGVVSSSDASSTDANDPASKLGLIVGLISGFLAIVGFLVGTYIWYHRSSPRGAPGGHFLDPPPPYDK